MKSTFERIFRSFSAPVVPLDCGRKCAPHNEGIPVCCDTGHAIPIMAKAEYKVLRKRSDLWHKYKPKGKDGRAVVDEISDECVAAECKGARFCERDNRSLSCRAFPFFPYITKQGEFIGLATYWTFEDRCWVISNMGQVTPEFVAEFFDAYETLFEADPAEFDVYKDHSATMRRVFSRKKRAIYIVDREMTFRRIKPKGGGMKKVKKSALPKHGPYAD